MFSQAEINLMEKQLLFLLDYDLGIKEEEIIENFKPFLDQYEFESPVMASSSTMSTPAPVTPVRPAPAQRQRHQRVVSRGQDTYVAPPLDRSGSSSSLESNDMPLTPKSNSPPTPPRASAGKRSVSSAQPQHHYAQQKAMPRSTSISSLDHNVSSSNLDAAAKIQIQAQIAAATAALGKPLPSSTTSYGSNGFLGRFLRSADKRKSARSKMEEEEEQAIAALSWNAV
jgi:hypothetical protein